MENAPPGPICYDGDRTGLRTCCDNYTQCTNAEKSRCDPCVSFIKGIPINEEVWKEDICDIYCPSYWKQRQFFDLDDSQLCSDTYKTLCDLAGCDPDPACKIKWGGCEYTKIDCDICNGGDWTSPFLPGYTTTTPTTNPTTKPYTPINRCKLTIPSNYCTNNNLCVTKDNNLCETGTSYSKKCTNDPINTPPILPTVVRRR